MTHALSVVSHHLHTKHWFIKASRPVNDNGADMYGDCGVVGAAL